MNGNSNVLGCREVTLLDDLTIQAFQCYQSFSRCWLRGDSFFIVTWNTPPSLCIGSSGTVLTGDLKFDVPHKNLSIHVNGEAKSFISSHVSPRDGRKSKQDVVTPKWVDGSEVVTVLQYFPPTSEQPGTASVLVAIGCGLRILEDS